MKKALITGISGFAGSFLAEHLVEKGECEVFGTSLTNSPLDNLINIKDKIKIHELDLIDKDKIENLINEIAPDLIFHLAALTSPKESFKNPSLVLTNNITAEINILEAIKNKNLLNSKILIISSVEVYGMVDTSDLPIDEETKLKPANPYAVSKVAQDFLGLQYYLSNKLGVIRVRPFNHIGPRQAPIFVVSSFAKKIAEIEKKINPPIIKVGNLEAKRDFTDVRDMVKAYQLIIEKGELGEVYNIGSGKSYKISDILEKLLSFSNTSIKVEIDELLFKPADATELICDYKKINTITGWESEIPIEKSLKDTLDYWRKIV